MPMEYAGRDLIQIQSYNGSLWAITKFGEYIVRWNDQKGWVWVAENCGPWV